MLAPPPEGTFDIEDSNLPVSNPLREGAVNAKSSTPEKVPLLTQAPQPDPGPVKRGKVRLSRTFVSNLFRDNSQVSFPYSFYATFLSLGLL